MHAAYSVQLIAYNQPGDRLACTLIKTCTPLCSQQLLPVAVHNVFANSSGSLQQKLADLHKFSDTFARFLNRRLVCAFASFCICSVCCLYFVYLRSFPLERQSVVSSSFVSSFAKVLRIPSASNANTRYHHLPLSLQIGTNVLRTVCDVSLVRAYERASHIGSVSSSRELCCLLPPQCFRVTV